jgi:hypothetical protein
MAFIKTRWYRTNDFHKDQDGTSVKISSKT